MEIKLSIGELAKYIEEFTNTKLNNEEEIRIAELGIRVPTPTGLAPVEFFIKKEQLPTKKVTLDNGYTFDAANKHILQNKDGQDIFVEDLMPGDLIQKKLGLSTVIHSSNSGINDCFDIGIQWPHVYYDENGILHHNTILTGVLSHKCEPYGRTIVVVPSKDLVKQTEADYINMGLDVGVFFGDRKEYTKTHTICTWQSLNSLFKNTKDGSAQIPFADFIDGVICIMIDEAHGLKADALLALMTGPLSRVPIRWGITGTIPKEDFEKRSLQVSIGEVVGTVRASELQEKGVLSNCHIYIKQLVDHGEYKMYQDELRYLLNDADRLHYLAGMIQEISKSGNTLVLIDRVEPGKALVNAIPGAVFLSGASKSTVRTAQYESIATTDNTVTICTFGIAAIGINVPRLFNVILIEPGKSFVRVIQSIGRGLRLAHDKDEVNIIDVTSTCKFSKRHLTTRKKYYTEAGYPFSIEKIDWQEKSK